MAKKQTMSPERAKRLAELEKVDAQFAPAVEKWTRELLYDQRLASVVDKMMHDTMEWTADGRPDAEAVACDVLGMLLGIDDLEIIRLTKTRAAEINKAFKKLTGTDLKTAYGWAYESPIHEFVREFAAALLAAYDAPHAQEVR